MNIALCHYRVGETDGVSLEMEKWKIALEKMGHKVFYLAGSKGTRDAYIIPELQYKQSENLKFIENAYVAIEDYSDEKEMQRALEKYTEKLENHLEEFIKKLKIDVLIPNNIWSRGWNLPAAVGFYNVIKKCNVKCIAHHHDFYWERDKFKKGTSDFINKCLDTYSPPDDPLIKHVVINELTRKELKKRKKIEAVVVPNVFDFSAPLWMLDNYNADFRKTVGVDQNDILILQATRIVERKAIELAIDVVGEMLKKDNLNTLYSNKLYDGRQFRKENKIIFVLAGLHEFSSRYIELLKERASNCKVKLLFINELIEDVRCNKNGEKCYSLWDAFASCDIVTYPSIWEGWGNQFLETVFAKKPVIVYEYPVYLTDIKNKNFDIISLGSEYEVCQNGLVKIDMQRIKNASKQSIDILIDNDLRSKVVNKNFEIAKNNFSYKNLEDILKRTLNNI
ncbi:MAG TPA: glycosyltransferase [Victivallales bacterium]|nr:glycosyltransferase [Victivallales bacterium]